MRRAIFLLGILLFLSLSAGAQNSRVESPIGTAVYAPWQISVAYQYNLDNLVGSPFRTNGVNTSFSRYFGRWFGIEAQMGVGFGNTAKTSNPPNLTTHSIFAGAGPRLAYRNSTRLEPWIHCTVGREYFRFSQPSGLYQTNNALAGAAGGGLDLYMSRHISLRAEADEMGSRFFSTNQRHFQIIGGFVLEF